jgi:Tfp pilus assembly protein PilX
MRIPTARLTILSTLFAARSSRAQSRGISGQPGQIAVVILLIMAVLLVLGLSLAARTTQEIQLSGQEQDSTRVFNAAETGVEKALSDTTYFSEAESTGSKTIDFNTGDLPTGLTANVTITPQSGLTTYVNEGASATIQLAGASPTLSINWSKRSTETTCNSRAALIVALYYTDAGVDKVQYTPVKPNCGYDAARAVGFSETNVVTNGAGDYNHTFTFAVSVPNPKLARIKPLYAGTDLNITGVSNAQAFDIRSEASEDPTGQTTVEKSAIQVTRTKPAPPTVLEYAVYSGGSLIKN